MTIDQIIEMITDMYPGHEWGYDSIPTVHGTVYHIKCDDSRIRVGYSDQIANQLASLGGPDASNQILTTLKIQLDEHFNQHERKEKKTKKEIY